MKQYGQEPNIVKALDDITISVEFGEFVAIIGTFGSGKSTLLNMLDMTEAADKPVKSYSLGMKERLGIARDILCEPGLLILDEPTNGLDPAGMKQIRELLKKLCAEQGITIMISSHILSEIENIADTVGIIHYGQMMKEISMRDIEEANQNYLVLYLLYVQKVKRKVRFL